MEKSQVFGSCFILHSTKKGAQHALKHELDDSCSRKGTCFFFSGNACLAGITDYVVSWSRLLLNGWLWVFGFAEYHWLIVGPTVEIGAGSPWPRQMRLQRYDSISFTGPAKVLNSQDGGYCGSKFLGQHVAIYGQITAHQL